jgi:TetR/AcrR family transcriptional regulator
VRSGVRPVASARAAAVRASRRGTLPAAGTDPEGGSHGAILAAARVEFSANGLSGGRVNRIAERAGVNKQLIFYYFGSKAGLYQAIIERAASDTVSEESASPGTHAAGELRRAFNTMFDTLARQPDLTRLILLDAQTSGKQERPSRAAVRDFLLRLRELIAAGQGHGFFRDDVDPDRMATQALVLGLGYFMIDPILEGPPDPGRALVWRDGAVELLLSALTW